MERMFQGDMDEYLPLRDVVFKTLRKGILTGELKPGERLMEIHLANKLGVSRTPIREAIRKLELEGLVTMIPRRGAEVAQITPKSMKDVLEVLRKFLMEKWPVSGFPRRKKSSLPRPVRSLKRQWKAGILAPLPERM